jgi:hypothetical protein
MKITLTSRPKTLQIINVNEMGHKPIGKQLQAGSPLGNMTKILVCLFRKDSIKNLVLGRKCNGRVKVGI